MMSGRTKAATPEITIAKSAIGAMMKFFAKVRSCCPGIVACAKANSGTATSATTSATWAASATRTAGSRFGRDTGIFVLLPLPWPTPVFGVERGLKLEEPRPELARVGERRGGARGLEREHRGEGEEARAGVDGCGMRAHDGGDPGIAGERQQHNGG